MPNQTKNRIKWLDFIRSLAIIMVVWCHATESIYALKAEGMCNLSRASRLFGVIAFTLGRCGVPMFLLLSGYLLLGRDYSTPEKVWKFWKKKWVPLFLAFEIWTVINQIYSVVFYQEKFNVLLLIKRMLFVQKSQLGHMWYMPMILGIYLMLPFIGIVVQKYPPKIFLIPVLICFFYYFLVPNINIVLQVIEKSKLERYISLEYTGGVYGLYLVSGYLSRRIIEYLEGERGSKRKTKVSIGLIFIIGISFGCSVLFQIWCYFHGKTYKVWYDFGLLFLCASALFLLVGIQKEHLRWNGIWTRISTASLGIYFLHNLIKYITLKNNMMLTLWNRPFRVIVLAIGLFLSSYLVEETVAIFFPRISSILFLRKRKAPQKPQ